LEKKLQKLSTDEMQVAVEIRFGTNVPELQRQAAALVANNVDLIFAQGTMAAMVAQRATASIPIVYTIAGDPVASGLASTLARPGANATGIYGLVSEVSGKRVSLLREAVPRARKFGLLWTPVAANEPEFNNARAAAETLGTTPVALEARTKEDLSSRFTELRGLGVDAVSVLTAPPLAANLELVADLALRHRVPAVAGYAGFANLGGLMSYTADPAEAFSRAVALAEMVLKGARPMDLPIQRSDTFVLTINLKTAASLGLSIPAPLLVQAQRVIQ
jgi:putative ABC transport system substrate-binding protein